LDFVGADVSSEALWSGIAVEVNTQGGCSLRDCIDEEGVGSRREVKIFLADEHWGNVDVGSSSVASLDVGVFEAAIPVGT